VDLIQAAILGIVQGLTEYLPVSSTAHIRILPALVGWPDPGAAFTAVVQVGTLVAVLIYFAKDLGRAIAAWAKSFCGGEAAKTPEAKLGWAVFIGTLPIIVLGLAFHKQIESGLRSLYIVAASLILMGLVLLASERIGAKGRNLSLVRPVDGLWVGLWQCIALIPGASRSGSTISGSLLLGFDRATAARFSFLLSVPSVFAAAVYELIKQRHDLLGAGLPAVIVGNLFSFVVGYWSIAFLMKFLQTRSVLPFVIYRVALGLAIIGLLVAGIVHPDEGIEGHRSADQKASLHHVPTKAQA
jgi:undecaprenyl-diphosphatase